MTTAGGLLEVRDVSMRFGGNMALDRVSLQADAGQVTGLIGPNGAGKTTLFNIISGLLRPQRGDVFLAAESITRVSPHRRARRGVARTFQRLELFGLLTVRENVELAASVRGLRRPKAVAGELMEMAGLADMAETRADELPTGRARLVELARALATRPRVLLLDEPASGQDEQETEAFALVLERIAAGDLTAQVSAEPVAVVLVEHDVQLVMRVCQTVNVLDFGVILASGSPDEVQHNKAVQDAYLGSGPATASVTPTVPGGGS